MQLPDREERKRHHLRNASRLSSCFGLPGLPTHALSGFNQNIEVFRARIVSERRDTGSRGVELCELEQSEGGVA